MDAIVPGGVARDLDARTALQAMRAQESSACDAEVARLKTIYDEHPGLQDRFIATGRCARNSPSRLG